MSKKAISSGNANTAIRNAIQKIALHGLYNPKTDTLNDVGNIIGYVAAIHTDGDLIGTIDVQEYSNSLFDVQGDDPVGYHTGVYLSAIQNNEKGLVVVPKLYSDVIITRDPVSNKEFVTMVSHVDIIQLDSHDTIIVGVREREDFDPNSEDGADIDELKETGVHAVTTYKKDTIVNEVQGEDDANKTTQTIDDTKFNVVAGDDKTSIIIDKDKAHIKHDKAEVIVDDNGVETKMGSSMIKIEDGVVHLGNNQNTDDAVLGGELADILCDLLGYIAQIQTTTQLGPQPPLNIASFISLKAKITAFKNSHSGFLTSKVKVQK